MAGASHGRQVTGAPDVDVLVVGGGPAGLAAARAARRAGAVRVLVAEREDDAGGIPRHCAHTGFGLRDLHRLLDGPAYARRITALTRAAGVEVATRTMVTGWTPDGSARLTGPGGPAVVTAGAVVLATGARERPRAARLVPGDRPAGVLTTGELQQRVHLHHLDIGRRAIVVGAEHVSYSACLTLRDAGVRTLGMVTEWDRHQSSVVFATATAVGLRVPLWTGTRLTAIRGRGRVEAVELTDVASGRSRTIEADTVVFTGDWIPDHELARAAAVTVDPASRGPEVDQCGATSAAGFFAAGNLVHPAETAGIAALGGRRAGAAAAAWAGGARAARGHVAVVAAPPLRWVSPARVTPGEPAADRVIARTSRFVDRATVVIEQEQSARPLARQRVRAAAPNRSLTIAAQWMEAVDPAAGPVVIRVEEGRATRRG
jgi:NADPH-dependent 2,4-dienoyl-CoA reductase/sulfur reductase-like enzyme